ncbi:hypothetical protein OUO20_06730 [Arthrobacter sp. FX8]|uniref:hypothetical protein n=1 Tax=Arthrobacter sp. FX8 TaxID=2997335 RepID=UPI00227C90CD|nr:hypothetical protein [Arthrobacter sp. FX8]WAJ34604.1 hypothetical protein OUO20_06730 [Arthrobacter sp. FX8]
MDQPTTIPGDRTAAVCAYAAAAAGALGAVTLGAMYAVEVPGAALTYSAPSTTPPALRSTCWPFRSSFKSTEGRPVRCGRSQ